MYSPLQKARPRVLFLHQLTHSESITPPIPKIPQDEPKHVRQIGISADVPLPICWLYHTPADNADEPYLVDPLTLAEDVWR